MTLDHITQAAEAAKSALRSRDEAIRKAVKSGATRYAVAKAAGLDHRAIQRIIEREGNPGTRW